MRLRDRVQASFLKTRDRNTWKPYKTLRNEVNRKLREVKRGFISQRHAETDPSQKECGKSKTAQLGEVEGMPLGK